MSRQYPFKVENETYQWPKSIITGRDVRGVGPGIPAEMDLYLKEKEKPGRLIGLDDEVDLSKPGIERFYAQNASSEAGQCRC
jgi:hypothetical protein